MTTKTEERKRSALSVLFTALAKCQDKSMRAQLEDGSAYGLDVTVVGTVMGRSVKERVTGTLSIGHATTYNASQPVAVELLVARLLAEMPKTRLAHVLNEFPSEFQKTGELAPADDGLMVAAEGLLSRLRKASTQQRKGAVSFTRSDV